MDIVGENTSSESDTKCCVPNCTLYTDTSSFHNFPTDPKLSNRWKILLGIQKPIETSMVVCSGHFTDDAFYYETTNKNDRCLKQGMIPNQNLPHKILKLTRDEFKLFKKRYKSTEFRSELFVPENIVKELFDGNIKKIIDMPFGPGTRKDFVGTSSRVRVRKNDNTSTHLVSGNVPFSGTNGSALKDHRKEKKYTALDVSLRETPINNKVLRVRIKRNNLKDLKQCYKFWSENKLSRSGRKIKSKLLPGFNITLPKLSDGAPDFDQYLSTDSGSSRLSTFVNKRTKKRKLNEDVPPIDRHSVKVEKNVPCEEIAQTKKRRVGRPKINGTLKLQDQNRNNTLIKASAKAKEYSLTKKQEHRTLNKVIQKPSVRKNNTSIKKIRLVGKAGEKLQVKILPPNKRNLVDKDTPNKGKLSLKVHDSSKSTAIRVNPFNKIKTDSTSKTTPNKQAVVKQPFIKLTPIKQTPTKQIPVKQTLTKQIPIKQTPTKQIPIKPKPVKENVHLKGRTSITIQPKKVLPTTEVKNNGHMQLRQEILYMKQPSSNLTHYYLKLPNFRSHCDGTLKYRFQSLVSDMKTLKLPSPAWKIKVIIRQNNVSGVTLTNKAALERSVSFYADKTYYNIKIDNQLAYLLGSPSELSSKNDIEILLDIIETIDSTNPMIQFK